MTLRQEVLYHFNPGVDFIGQVSFYRRLEWQRSENAADSKHQQPSSPRELVVWAPGMSEPAHGGEISEPGEGVEELGRTRPFLGWHGSRVDWSRIKNVSQKKEICLNFLKVQWNTKSSGHTVAQSSSCGSWCFIITCVCGRLPVWLLLEKVMCLQRKPVQSSSYSNLSLTKHELNF